jgi:hypothetical protein
MTPNVVTASDIMYHVLDRLVNDAGVQMQRDVWFLVVHGKMLLFIYHI